MRSLLAVGLFCILLLTAVGLLSVGGAASTPALEPPVLAPDQPTPDETETHVELAADGTATWEISLRTRLTTTADVERYEQFQQRFKSNRSRYLDPIATHVMTVVTATNRTHDRSMSVQNLSATTAISPDGDWGVMTVQFTWDGVGRPAGDRIFFGDVFEAYTLAVNDTMTVTIPENATITGVIPPPDDRTDQTVTWDGPTTFDPGEPAVQFRVFDGAGAGSTLPRGLAGVAIVLFGLALFGAYWYTRRRAPLSGGGDRRPPPRGADSLPSPAAGERIVTTLAANGGQLQRATLAAKVDWSDQQLSRTLTALEEAGRIKQRDTGTGTTIELVVADDHTNS